MLQMLNDNKHKYSEYHICKARLCAYTTFSHSCTDPVACSAATEVYGMSIELARTASTVLLRLHSENVAQEISPSWLVSSSCINLSTCEQ